LPAQLPPIARGERERPGLERLRELEQKRRQKLARNLTPERDRGLELEW
jgi:hypothetical protein